MIREKDNEGISDGKDGEDEKDLESVKRLIKFVG